MTPDENPRSIPPAPQLIQLGCGPAAAPTAWTDFDGSWNAWLNKLPAPGRAAVRFLFRASGRTSLIFPAHVKYLNLHNPLPYPDAGVDAIYASHVWEHLYYEDARRATLECWRILKAGGRLRLVVPNLRLYCEEYLAEVGSAGAAMKLQTRLLYRDLARQKNLIYRVYTALTEFHLHKFMYDEAALAGLLADAGFHDVRTCGYLESGIPLLSQVESPGRLLDGAGFAVEGRKP